jgi:hypothetical protein
LEGIHAAGIGVKRKGWAISPTEGAEFVKADDMIEMAVGVKDGIEPTNASAEGLLA